MTKIYWIALSVLLYGCTTYYINSTGDHNNFIPDADVNVRNKTSEHEDMSEHTQTTDASKAISEVEHIINDELKIDTKVDNSTKEKTNNSKHETDIDVDLETKLK